MALAQCFNHIDHGGQIGTCMTGAAAAASSTGSSGGPRKLEDANVIVDLPGFLAAIEGSSTDPANPSSILVSSEAVLDFDEATDVSSIGLIARGKYFDATCVDYDEGNKCTLERKDSRGRFFSIYGPSAVSFTGFRFVGGFNWYGGAIAVTTSFGKTKVASADFTDCEFLENSAGRAGGAVHVRAVHYSNKPSLSFTRCLFDSNTASRSRKEGGAIYADAGRSGSTTVDIVISESTFVNNGAVDGTELSDIKAKATTGSNPPDLILDCTETTTSGTDTVDFPNGQVCSGPNP